jgi:hypothetical protein
MALVYQTFRCPICGEAMPEYKDEKEDDSNNDTEYDKTMYRCKEDDVWVTIEVPVQNSDQSTG